MADKRYEAAGGEPRPGSEQEGNAPSSEVTIELSSEDCEPNDKMVVSPPWACFGPWFIAPVLSLMTPPPYEVRLSLDARDANSLVSRIRILRAAEATPAKPQLAY